MINDFSKYKFRPSQLGKLMKGVKKPLTIIQEEKLKTLLEKKEAGKITDNQMITLGELLKKKNSKTILSEGAKNYLKSIFVDHVFGRSKAVKSKYLEKGIIAEQDNIDMYNEYRSLFLIKNEKRFENQTLTGCPDAIDDGIIYEFKSSWDYTTFPLMEEEIPSDDYYWQIQGYLHLLNIDKGKLVYGLVNTPDSIIDQEKKSVCRKLGCDELPEELEEEIEKNMKYNNIDISLRIKEFDIQKDENLINQINEIVELSREFLNELGKKNKK